MQCDLSRLPPPPKFASRSRRPALVSRIYAKRPIKADDELLTSYLPSEMLQEKRKQVLREQYRFECKCAKRTDTGGKLKF